VSCKLRDDPTPIWATGLPKFAARATRAGSRETRDSAALTCESTLGKLNRSLSALIAASMARSNDRRSLMATDPR